MVWTVLDTLVIVGAWLLARGIWQFAGAMENKDYNDLVYKRNLQKLIAHHRQFEKKE